MIFVCGEMGTSKQTPSVKRQKEEMIAHVATIANGETEEEPFVFSPRISEDGSTVRRPRERKLMKRLRSVLCCAAPNVNTIAMETGGSPTVYPSDEGTEFIIGERREEDGNKKTLVLDLDETLVHSSFNRVESPDFVIPVEIDGRMMDVFVQKRPGLDAFLHRVCPKFEVVIFTASLRKYANPLLDLLDPEKWVRWRLFRDACSTHKGAYVKDLGRLGRELKHTVIVDNSPMSYIFQPENALPISGFVGDPDDDALVSMLPILDELAEADDVKEGIRRLLTVETENTHSASNGEVATPIADQEEVIN